MKKILGMGNALVDILIQLDGDSILDVLGLPKGSMRSWMLTEATRSSMH